MNNIARMAELTGARFDMALPERGPDPAQHPARLFLRRGRLRDPASRSSDRARPGAEQSLDEAAKLLAEAKFPVIVAGGGVVMSRRRRLKPRRWPSTCTAPVVNTYLHNDSFPADHPLWCGPLGYQGSKAAMKLIAQADVVLALGTRLGPFGTLPQHGLDYWPKNAKIIQVDSDHRMLGLVKQISVGICGDAKAAAQALLNRLPTAKSTARRQRRRSA